MKTLLFAIAIAFSFHTFAEEPEAQNDNQPANVIPSDYNLADHKNDDDNKLDVHAAVEKYLEEHPDCASQRERICEVYILKDKSEKCGKGFTLAEAGGWSFNATKFKARTYERTEAQGRTRAPGQSSHKVYGFGVCHKF